MQEAVLNPISQYFNLVRLIRGGSFGQVYECTDLNNIEGQHFAVKIIDKTSVKRHKIDNLRNEAKILQTINHQNIIKFIGILESQTHIYIKMEYAKGGTLKQYMRKRVEQKNNLKQSQISKILKCIFSGLNYIHSLDIVHRDIKPQNILLSEIDDINNLKIADFGMSIQTEHKNAKLTTHCGTLFYMAPQMVCRNKYSKSIDVWAAAIIMYMLYNEGSHPLIPKDKRSTINIEQYALLIINPWPVLENHQNSQLSQANDFLRKLSSFQSSQRYSASDAVQHPFLGGQIAPLTYSQRFKGFQVQHQSNQLIRTIFICTQILNTSTKLIVPRDYIQKVQKFNQIAFQRKVSESLKKPVFRKVISDDNVFINFRNTTFRNLSQQTNQLSNSPVKRTNFNEFINLNLVQTKSFVQSISLKPPVKVQKNSKKFHISKPKRINSFVGTRNFDVSGRYQMQPTKSIKSSFIKHMNVQTQLLKPNNYSIDRHLQRESFSSGNNRKVSLLKNNKQTIITNYFKK